MGVLILLSVGDKNSFNYRKICSCITKGNGSRGELFYACERTNTKP